jgi:thiol-disulfide isomerase/thioredoxin
MPGHPLNAFLAGAVCAVLLGGLSACDAPGARTEGVAMTPDGGIPPGYSLTTEGLTPEQTQQFKDAITRAGGQLDLRDLPPDLRAALLANAVATPSSNTRPADFPGDLDAHPMAGRFQAPPQGTPLDGAFVDPDGRTVRLSDLRGGHTLVSVWATWCAPCLVEKRDLAALKQRLSAGAIRIVSLQSERNAPDLGQRTSQALASAGAEGMPKWRDASPEGDAIMMASGGQLPLTLLIGPDGREIARMVGSHINPDGPGSVWASPQALDFLTALAAQPAPP